MQPSTEDQVYALGEKHVLAISMGKIACIFTKTIATLSACRFRTESPTK